MFKKSKLKEFIRYIFSVFLVYKLLEIFILLGLANEENKNQIANNFIEDLERFLFIPLENQQDIDIFLIIYSIFITTFIFFSYWFNNPYLYKEKVFYVYRKLFIFTTLGSIFFFYFFRIYNISRAYLIIFLLTLPFVFIFIRSGGIISKIILRESKVLNFIHLFENSAYGDEVYFIKNLDNNREVKKIPIENRDVKNLYIEMLNIQKTLSYDFIFLNINKLSRETNDLINLLINLKKPILFAEKNFSNSLNLNLPLKRINIENFNLVFLSSKVQDGIELMFKRIIDIFFSIFLLVCLAPFFIFLYLFIFYQDFKNPIVQIRRTGLYGKDFRMYKFRTMYVNAHKERDILQSENQRKGPLFKINNDPRIIPNLKWVRDLSFDELPQLLNVLKGDMSLVGPRPLFSEDLKKFKDEETLRLTVLPGITGLLQVNDRETDDFNTWIKWDIEYIENWSLFLDLKILLMTPFKIKKSN